MEVTTTGTKAGKFDARFYHLVFEEEIGRVKGHFGPINSLAFHPDGKRLAQSTPIRNCLVTCDIYISLCSLVIAVAERMVMYEYTLLIQRTLTLSLNTKALHVIIG